MLLIILRVFPRCEYTGLLAVSHQFPYLSNSKLNLKAQGTALPNTHPGHPAFPERPGRLAMPRRILLLELYPLSASIKLCLYTEPEY